MPYIKPDQRPAIDQHIDKLQINDPGALNYAITRLGLRYLLSVPDGYKSLNELIGVLECAKLELYRQHVAPYEDVKRELNGDVNARTPKKDPTAWTTRSGLSGPSTEDSLDFYDRY